MSNWSSLTRRMYRAPLLGGSRCQVYIKPQRTPFIQRYSGQSTDKFEINGERLTFENVLSSDNKSRVQRQLLNETPIRSKILKDAKKAAVLIPLCLIDNVPSILLTQRSFNISHHKGEVSFPGGLLEESDKDLIDTALREMHEELYIEPTTVDIWGQLSKVGSRNGQTAVTPVLGFLGDIDVNSIQFNEDEVSRVLYASLPMLCDPRNCHYTTFKSNGHRLPSYTGLDIKIWGLTAVIIHLVMKILAPGLYTFNFDQPGRLPKSERAYTIIQS